MNSRTVMLLSAAPSLRSRSSISLPRFLSACLRVFAEMVWYDLTDSPVTGSVCESVASHWSLAPRCLRPLLVYFIAVPFAWSFPHRFLADKLPTKRFRNCRFQRFARNQRFAGKPLTCENRPGFSFDRHLSKPYNPLYPIIQRWRDP